MLGVLKAGAAYVPLEPKLPKERLGYMVRDAGIGWALLQASSMSELPLQGVDVIVMDGAGSEEEWLEEYAQGALPTVAATDLAYVIYTSGSTGRPKGVMVPHRGVANFLATMARRPDLAQLALTCENTTTVLPTIDLVTEVLEFVLAHGQLTQVKRLLQRGHVAVIDEQFLALLDFDLPPAVRNDRVHGRIRGISSNCVEIGPIEPRNLPDFAPRGKGETVQFEPCHPEVCRGVRPDSSEDLGMT